MSDSRRHIQLPSPPFSGRSSVPASAAQDDDVFAAHQVEFIQHLFGHCAYLREHARATPVSDAFLAVFVNLFDTLQANAPAEAHKCAAQFQQILGIIAPGTASPGASFPRTDAVQRGDAAG